MPDIPDPVADRPADGGRAASARPMDLGIYGRTPPEIQITGVEIGAAVLSVAWLAGAGLLGLWGGAPDEAGQTTALPLVFSILGLAVPVALIWVGALSLRTAGRLRAEAAGLRAAMDTLRHAQLAQQQTAALRPAQPPQDRPQDRRTAPGRAAIVEDQPRLALGTPTEDGGPPLVAADFIRALNFPETDQDREGFRVLRLALADRGTAKLIRAAQDVLTLLSEEGIYMDDLPPDAAPAELWRKFAQGERGRGIAALGGVHDRSSLGLTAARMRKDPIFRDAAHHFLRQFDRTLAEFEKTATDADLIALADTRTARAFMLLGRASGTFD